MKAMKIALFAAAAALVAPAAQAEGPAPLAEHNMSMGLAQAIIAGAIEQCTKDGYKVSVYIVDKGGQPFASMRGDGTNPHTLEFARMKAYTARTRNQTSLEFMQAASTPEGGRLLQIPGVVAIGGGVPIKMGTETIGAVGVSGAPGGEKDEACAKAGIEKVAAALK